MTRYEIFNSDLLKYLFTTIIDIRKGQPVNIRKNYIENGILSNIKSYIKKTKSNLLYI